MPKHNKKFSKCVYVNTSLATIFKGLAEEGENNVKSEKLFDDNYTEEEGENNVKSEKLFDDNYTNGYEHDEENYNDIPKMPKHNINFFECVFVNTSPTTKFKGEKEGKNNVKSEKLFDDNYTEEEGENTIDET